MSNYSGADHIVINTRERAVSNDINNAAKSAARQASNRFGRWLGTSYPEITGAGSNVHGYDIFPVQGDTPLQSDIYGGLRVRPFSTFLLVTAGTIGCWTNNGGIDSNDSAYSLIDDVGVSSTTALTFTANAGPGIRVDVVECSVAGGTVLAQESRDIFDPTTGLFTAALVPKRVASTLNYRVRLGTQGAGYPGSAAGWTPLAVVITPNGAASFADCDFYDVRPLVLDRIDGLKASYNDASLRVLHASNNVDPATGVIQGFYDVDGSGAFVTDTGAYRTRGVLRSTVPGASDSPGIALNDASNWANGTTFSGSQFGYVVALFPENLPRWVKYSTLTTPDGERLPLNTMGILTLCQGPITACCSTGGAVINPPFSTGLTNASGGMMVAMYRYSTAGGYPQNIAPTFRASDGSWRLRDASDNALLFQNGAITGGNGPTDIFVQIDFDLNNVGALTGKVPFTTTFMKWSLTMGYSHSLAQRVSLIWQVRRGGVVIASETPREITLETASADKIVTDDVQFSLPNQRTAAGTPGTSGNIVVRFTIQGTALKANGFVANNFAIHLSELKHGVF